MKHRNLVTAECKDEFKEQCIVGLAVKHTQTATCLSPLISHTPLCIVLKIVLTEEWLGQLLEFRNSTCVSI